MRTDLLIAFFADRRFWGESIILMLVTPFLLFPNTFVWATAVSLLLLAFVWTKGIKRLPVTAVNLPLLILISMVLVGCLITADPDWMLAKASGVILGISVWRFAVCFAHGERWWLGVGLLLLLGCSFVGVGVLATDWLNKMPVVGDLTKLLPESLVQLPDVREGGVQSNQLAGTILLVLPFSVGVAWYKRAGWLIVLGLTAVLFLSQSRFGWFGLASGLAVALLWFGWGNKPTYQWARYSLVGGLAIVSISMIIMGLRDPQFFTLENWRTLQFRFELWRWAWLAIGDFPFTGVGFGAFREVVYRMYPIDLPYLSDLAHAHNLYLQMALDVGLIGLGAYVWLLTRCGRMGWHVWREGEADKRPFAFAILITLITFHFYGLGDTLALGSKTHVLFWGLLGLLTAVYQSTLQAPKT